MRLKKRILLYCANESLGSRIAFVLGVRCIHPSVIVTSTFSPEGFLWESIAAGAEFDCVVVVRTKQYDADDRKVLALLHGDDIGRLTVEVLNGEPPINESCAQKRVSGAINASMCEIVETVRMACARKRGPKGPTLEKYHYQLATIGKAA